MQAGAQLDQRVIILQIQSGDAAGALESAADRIGVQVERVLRWGQMHGVAEIA